MRHNANVYVILAACWVFFASACAAPPIETPVQTAMQSELRRETVEAEADFIIAFEFAPDGRLLYATREGEVFVKTVDFKEPWNSPPSKLILHLDVARSSYESGLLGLAIDPDYTKNNYLYLYYVAPNAEGQPNGSRIVRYTIKSDTPTEETIIINNLPSRSDQEFHFGGGLSFGPDGKLYLIFGDTNIPEEALNPDSPFGSILRFNPDGSIPEDNPFPGSPVFAHGFRNGFGLAWHPENDQLYEIENGHTCDDELNLIEPGGYYGWGKHLFDVCPYSDRGGIAPVHQWESIIAPSGIVFYEGDVIPEWDGDLLVCAFNTLALHRLVLDDEGQQVVKEEIVKIPDLDYTCRVDLEVGPDGWLYTTTDSAIFRIGK